jgi:1-acyl-sn-glycerol-3-phosphate acyltransferase
MRRIFGHAARWFVRRLIRLYYPRIEVTGRDHIPRTGPVLLVANHANSLIDPVIVGIAADRPVRFFAKAPLFETPVLGRLMRALGMLPAFRGQDDGAQVRRNLESLNVGAQAMAGGEAVGIFPEGRSHDSIKLEQIRSGAARMAVQALQSGATELKLVAVGINYQRKQLFRSAIWVRVGRPVTVSRFLSAPGEDRKAIRALSEEMESRLKNVVIHLTEPAFEPFLDDLELLLPPPGRRRGHRAISALRQRKRLADAMNWFLAQDRAQASAIAELIRDHRSRLAAAGLASRSPVMRTRTWKLFLTLLLEGLWLAFWFPAVVIGTVFHIVPFFVVRALARRIQDGPTTTALSRLGLGLPVYALWYAGAWWALRSYFLPWVAWTFVLSMPLAGIFALTYAHRAKGICRSWWNQLRVLLRPARLRALREEQSHVRSALAGFVETYVRQFPSLDERPQKYSRRERVQMTLRWAAIAAVATGIFVWQNWYFADRGSIESIGALNLSGLSTNSLDAVLQVDERTLDDLIGSLRELEVRAAGLQAEFTSGKRSYYTQADNDAIRQAMFSYLACRTTLLGLVWKYQQHADVAEERLRWRAFLVSFASASAIADSSLKLVTRFAPYPEAVRKLNEADSAWNLPPGMFDMVRHNLLQPQTREFMDQSMAAYRTAEEILKRLDLTGVPPFVHFHEVIRRHAASRNELLALLAEDRIAAPLKEAKHTGRRITYRGQAFVSTWLGNTRFRQPRHGDLMIRPEQLAEFRAKLKPGDILIERQNWFLSRAFMPGYWAHAAIYVGTTNDLGRLGLALDPRVLAHWKQYAARDAQGHEHLILEAVPEGVRMTTLEHCIGVADAAAALRPRVSETEIREAIARAFTHLGKSYDFDFDFFSSDKIVCTELVYRSYDGSLQFPLVDVMGRKTLPPTELVRKFVTERGQPKAQLECVCFLDGDEVRGRALFKSEDIFATTVQRPGLILFPSGEGNSSK